ncbi:unnamed protein product [Pedinophyceae sp. YPF-701]|nr:unnamed protein product [Pedinophyceae sp. YPF-701]
MDEVLALNHGLNADLIVEGQTLLLPAGSLSKRDKEILAGIGSSTYRTYPVRKGEKIQDILGARKVTMEEAQGLNPGMDLNKLAEGQVIKLPPGKYTVREQEMMMGTARAPLEYFSAAGPVALGGLAGAVAGAGAAYLFMKKYVLDNVDGYETEDED